MGQATTEVTTTNLCDLLEVRVGDRLPEDVRKVVVRDATVDTKVTSLALPPNVIEKLGLQKRAEGWGDQLYDPVRIEIMGRDATIEPIESPDASSVIIGHVPLTFMDWVVDLQGRKLIGNPAHNGQQVLELL